LTATTKLTTVAVRALPLRTGCRSWNGKEASHG
jgi:hypothetical protein